MHPTAYLSHSDARDAAGHWPNPRWRMTDPDAIAARIAEDGARIAAERGSCSADDLTRLGWQPDQVERVRQALEVTVDELVEGTQPRDAGGRFARHPMDPRPPSLDDDAVAYGCERAA